MATKITRYYVGPLDEVATLLLDGTEVVVARGDKIEGTAADAERWDAQPTNWATSAAGPKPRTVAEILDDVGTDPDRAATELVSERARGGDARKTLVTDLERIIAGDNPKDGD